MILILVITLIDIITANGLGAMVANYVIGLPAKPILLTGGLALMLGAQLALAPAIGYWSDQRGRRPAAIAAAIASVLSSLFLLPIQTWGYVVNRFVKGGTNGLYSITRSAVADSISKDELLRYSGMLSFIISAGPVIGPMGAGCLILLYRQAGIHALPTVVLLLALGVLNVGLTCLFKETNDKREEVTFAQLKKKAVDALKIKALWQQLNDAEQQVPGVKPIFILNMLATLSLGYYAFFVAFLTQGKLLMSPRETAWFFLYFGGLAFGANLLFFTYIIKYVNLRQTILTLALLGVGLQIVYAFSESSVTLLYVVAGVDAISVSLLIGLIGGVLSQVIHEGGSRGEMFGNIQALGGLASFVTALINSLLSGVSMKAPFLFCALSLVAVAVWTMRLSKDATKHLDRKLDNQQPS